MKSILKKLFDKSDANITLQLGRFTDHDKPVAKYMDWETALDMFSRNDFFGSVQKFLSYLNFDESDNVIITENNPDKIKFKLFQGSKCVSGFANEDGFFAEVKIGKMHYFEHDLIKLLLEKNYELQYSSFALDSEDYVCMTFYADRDSASPYKLFYGLKELATTADKNDDVLSLKFRNMTPNNDGYIFNLSTSEKDNRYDLIQSKINNANELISKYSVQLQSHLPLKYYIVLATALTIDFLVKPEGILMEKIESIYTKGHSTNKIQFENKMQTIDAMMMELSAISKKDLYEELYYNKSTFGSLSPCNHKKVVEEIEHELLHYMWYASNGFKEMVLYMPLYIATNLLYKYALPLPDKLFLELLVRIIENGYFVANGYSSLIDNNGKLNKKKLLSEINKIGAKCQDLYVDFDLETSTLEFENIYDFSYSYLKAIVHINPVRK